MTDTRTRRLKSLSALIRAEALGSQEEATARLKALGFAVTQATVSRDLEQLGAVKMKRRGVLAYALPDQLAGADWSTARLERILKEWALSVDSSGQTLVLRTPPGSAHLVASAIDQSGMPEIAGTVSGDDTLFVALRDGVTAHAILKRFERMMGRGKVTRA
ncbi:MAG TPA: arginine repressor [Allosphingosinicella sp.]|nr:arginine repressor [Allosphingosinicella sp.]